VKAQFSAFSATHGKGFERTACPFKERVHSMPGDRLPAAVTDSECCDLARKIRELASQTRLMFAQRELLLLAAKFELLWRLPGPGRTLG